MRHTGGGLRLVALTVLAVGCLAVPTAAKQGSKADSTPAGQAQTPPGQAKKQAAAQQQVAAQPAPAPAPAATKKQAKADRKATKHGATATTQTSRQAATTTTTQPTKRDAKAQQASQPTGNGSGNGASAIAQSSTQTSTPPGQAKKAARTTVATAPAPAPVATPAPQTASRGSSRTTAKHRKASRHAAGARRTAARGAGTPVARIAPAPVATSTSTLTKTEATKTGKRGFVPARPKTTTTNDKPNVVFRTVRDAVEVIPATIWVLLGLLTALASLFAVTSARQTRRAHRLAAERGTLLGDVGVLQEAVLPVVPPRVGALALSVAHRPAGGPAAGGDFYDVIPLEGNRTALVVGDVTGHGSGALGQATLVRFTLRAHIESGAGPREALAIATDSLAPHFDEGFATAAVAIHDPDAGTLTYATAAHEAPIVVGPGEHHPVLVSSSPPLGIGAGPSARRQTIIPFPESSLACMLTDGALEARVRGELVGRARVEQWLRELGTRPAAGDMAELIRSRAAVSDDLAVCFATSTAGPDTGNWRVEELHRPTSQEAVRFLEACGAADEHKRAAAEALRFSREGTVLSVRFEDGAVVAADVLRTNSPKPVAA